MSVLLLLQGRGSSPARQSKLPSVSPAESCSLSNTTFPHVLPLLSLLEKSVAVGEGTEPWDVADVGVDVVMFHLGAARTMAQLGGIYRSNVESKLQST